MIPVVQETPVIHDTCSPGTPIIHDTCSPGSVIQGIGEINSTYIDQHQSSLISYLDQ